MKKALIYSLSLALLLSLTACHRPQADQQDTSQPDPAVTSTPADVSTPEPEPTTPEPATTPEPEKITAPEPVAPETEPEQTPPAPVENEETQSAEPVQQPKPAAKPAPANPDPDTGTYTNPNQVDDGSTGLTTGIGATHGTQEELTQGIDPNQNPWDVQGEMYYGGQQEDQSGGTGTQTQQTSKPSSGGKDIYGGFPTYKEYIDDICKQRPDKTREEIEAAFPDLATGHTDIQMKQQLIKMQQQDCLITNPHIPAPPGPMHNLHKTNIYHL